MYVCILLFYTWHKDFQVCFFAFALQSANVPYTIESASPRKVAWTYAFDGV